MKKIIVLTILIIGLFLSNSGAVFANAVWENPKSIKTYIEPNDKKELMKQAFSKWNAATNGKIAFSYVQEPKDAQIVVNFVKDASKSSNMEHAAGVTYHRSMGSKMVSARIEIANNAPNGAAFRKDAVYRVMVHEIGHAIGMFDHSEDKMSIMYAIKGSRYQDITPADIKFLAKLYGWN